LDEDTIIANMNKSKTFVMHVGPHKTASSSLQDLFMLNGALKDALIRDNYKVPIFHHGEFGNQNDGKNHAVLAHCFLSDSRNVFCPPDIRTEVLDEFRSTVHNAASHGSNILLSSEAFDFENLNTTEMTSFLRPYNYNIHVVVFYRRFYDWVYSIYNQQSKVRAKAGQSFKTFPLWLDKKMEVARSKYTAALRDRFKDVPGVFKVSVVNMHQGATKSNSAASFFCEHVDGAEHACDEARSIEMEKYNLSEDLDWLSLRAKIPSYHSINLLSPDDNRWELVEQKYHNMDNPPRLCLSDEGKNNLLTYSVQSEMALTPDSWHLNAEGLTNLMSDFTQKLNSKFCSIDVSAMLQSSEWQEFLSELEGQHDLEEGPDGDDIDRDHDHVKNEPGNDNEPNDELVGTGRDIGYETE